MLGDEGRVVHVVLSLSWRLASPLLHTAIGPSAAATLIRQAFLGDARRYRSEITSPLRSAATMSPAWRPDSVSTAPF
jgi:hypothetical protein